MDATVFWNVIGQYNQETFFLQFYILFFLILGFIISKYTKYNNVIKIELGIINLFIAFGFFANYGTEPIQKYFALPLYVLVGLLFFYEGFKNKYDKLTKITKLQMILIILFCLYPVISYALGNRYPKMVLYIMPCPVITISIAIYCMYETKNTILLLLLTIWGLTGIKSVIFNAYEDIILLMAGIYCGYVIFTNRKRNSKTGNV